MVKKFVLVLVFMAVVAGGVFAQWPATATWGKKKNFVSGTASILGGGVSFERFLAPKWSIGGDFYYSTLFIIWNEMEVGGFGRYYIWNGLFAEMGLGFHIHWGRVSGSKALGWGWSYDRILGFAITPGMGFKFDPGKPGGFYVEPGIKVPITLGGKLLGGSSWWWDDEPVAKRKGKFGVGVGIVPYVGLGFAF